MKLFRTVALGLATAAALFGISSAHAQQTLQASDTFTVGIALSAKCEVDWTDLKDVTLAYDSFRTTDVDDSTSFKMRCTTSLPYTVQVDPASSSMHGINYVLNLTEGAATPSSTANGSVTGAGTGSNLTYSIAVRALKDQAGTCTGLTCAATTPNTHTVKILY